MKISVITINYNNRVGLERTMDSITNQTYPDLEYIVIDGGSSDGSKEVIQSRQKKLMYWVSEADSGIYNAMNKGIRKSTGDYLLFINSGDVLSERNVLEHLLENINEKFDLIYGDLKQIYANGKQEIIKMPDFVTVDTLVKATLCHPVTLIKRSLFDKFGLYDESLKIVADWAFFLKIFSFGSIHQIHKAIIVTDFMMDGISSLPENAAKVNAERKKVMETLFSADFANQLLQYSTALNFYHYPGMNFVRSLRRFMNRLKK